MSDLIRREDALECFTGAYHMDAMINAIDAIRALPAVQPDDHVNKTPKNEHVPGVMLTLTAERDRLRGALRDSRRLLVIAQDDRIRLLIQLEQCEDHNE